MPDRTSRSRRTRAFGTWSSPLTARQVAARRVRFRELALDRETTYWVESRPDRHGQHVLVRRSSDGRRTDLTPPPFSVRSRVHEYGGGALSVNGSAAYFVNDGNRGLYRIDDAGTIIPICVHADTRLADLTIDPRHNRAIGVAEGPGAGEQEPMNRLISIDLGTGSLRPLVSGHDFFAAPRLSPDGRTLAWLTWDHPDMPWDGTALWIGTVGATGEIGAARPVAGGRGESVYQPEWSPSGQLHYVSDRSGWWNLYRWRAGETRALLPMDAEFGLPQWQLGTRTYAVLPDERLICSYTRAGAWYLGCLDPRHGQFERLDVPYREIAHVHASGSRALFVGGSPLEPHSIVQLDLETLRTEVLARSCEPPFDDSYISEPTALEFPTGDGQRAYAFFYPPRNPTAEPPPDERPPLLVLGHGGPTGASSSTLDLEVQFWTTRGLGVLDVNYRGSTGYGRAYRDQLERRWGIADVNDCVNGARDLVGRGWADPDRLAICGASAGGFTTLCALTFHEVFRAGASYYGVSDLERLVQDTHKFESRYLERLVGPYPAARAEYLARSPVHHTDRLRCPVIFFQGLDDPVVPPDQTSRMVEALRQRGVPVAYLPFEGEQHGFQRASSIQRALEATLFFFSRILAFEPSDRLEPVPIDNL